MGEKETILSPEVAECHCLVIQKKPSDTTARQLFHIGVAESLPFCRAKLNASSHIICGRKLLPKPNRSNFLKVKRCGQVGTVRLHNRITVGL